MEVNNELVKPDFLIVGAMKSGTSSLVHHCMNADHIAIPNREIHFFDQDAQYAKGNKWYSDQLMLHVTSSTTLIGEKTPSYGCYKKAARRIKDYCPQTKLIWIFRNPVDRTYSHYLHAKRKGSEFHNFKTALKRESKRAGNKDHLLYLYRSRYHEHVSLYLEFMDKQQMLFLKFEDFTEYPDIVLSKMFKFLGLNLVDFKFEDEHRNKTVISRSSRFRYVIRKIFGKDSGIYDLVNRGLAYGRRPGYKPMNSDLRLELLNYFNSHNQILADLIDFDISGWER